MATKLHNNMVQELVAAGVTRNGLFKEVRRIAKQYSDKVDLEAVKDTLRACRVVSDGWRYAACKTNPIFPGTFTAYEVSVTNSLAPWRVLNYSNLWFYLDCDYIGLRLIEKFRTGESEVSLIGVFFECVIRGRQVDQRFWDPNYVLPEDCAAQAAYLGIEILSNNALRV